MRETFKTTWGTVVVTAGAAIGLGNVWRFPYMMGAFGGSTFLLIYLAVVFFFGIPALMAEFALGRHTRRGPLGAFERSGMWGGRGWGYLVLLSTAMAGAYYGVVIGWVLYFAVSSLASPEIPAGQTTFSQLTSSFGSQSLALLATVAFCSVSLYWGVRRGIERVSRVITPLFFVLVVILIARSLTLPGAISGLQEYLVPNFQQLSPTTFLAATGQAFFSLALGGTFMLIYGSYLRADEDIPKTALLTALADVAASVLAGIVVVPAVLALAIDLSSGPSLLFVVMPEVFARLPLGGLFGFLFFASVFLIACLSLIAAYEVLVSALTDGFGWSRRKALLWISVGEIVLAVPSVMSVDYLFKSDLVWGSTMQPAGAVIAVVALAWFVGKAKTLDEVRKNSELLVPNWLYYWIKYVIPPAILGTLAYGWLG